MTHPGLGDQIHQLLALLCVVAFRFHDELRQQAGCVSFNCCTGLQFSGVRTWIFGVAGFLSKFSMSFSFLTAVGKPAGSTVSALMQMFGGSPPPQ